MRSFGAIAAGLAVGLACGDRSGGSAERVDATARAAEPVASAEAERVDATARAAEPAASAEAAPNQAGATVTGRVKFTGAKPSNPKIDMTEEPECKEKYTTPPTLETVVVNANGTLANVFVHVKSGLPGSAKYPTPTTPVVLDQQGCRYIPHAMGIMVGQPLEIKNSDPLLHNIKAKGVKNRGFNISQPKADMKTTRTFSAPETMVLLECNVHGWMTASLGVLPHPFYSTTGSDGTFSLKGLPAGTYTIEAWHEKYGPQTATVTVAGTETKTADFTFAAK